jgi:hypothetical protein
MEVRKMGPCTKCVHYRRVKPASQLLSTAIGVVAGGAEVAGALAKIVDDEQKVREAETDVKAKEGVADRQVWAARPAMSDYCGLKEADDIFLICEVKNRGMECKDFHAGQPERRACSNCKHHVGADGTTSDQAMERIYTQMVVTAAATQSSPQVAQGMLQSYRGGSASRKALEVAGAYAAKGWVLAKPQYLDYCRHFSTDDTYVLCVLQNPHSTCPEWTESRDQAKPKTKNS